MKKHLQRQRQRHLQRQREVKKTENEQNDANINVMAIVRKMRSTLEKRLEKSAKSLEDQRREKQRKIARWLEPKSI